MVLLSYILRVIRALSLPVLATLVFLQWFCLFPTNPFTPTITEGVKNLKKGYFDATKLSRSQKKKLLRLQHEKQRLISIPDFSQTGTFLLTDIFLMNSNFVAILSLYGFHYSNLLMALGGKTYLYLTLVLKVTYLWFGPAQHKPPNLHHQFPTSEGGSNGNADRTSCFDTKLRILTPDEVSSTDNASCLSNYDHNYECKEQDIDAVHHVWESHRSHEDISHPRIIKTQVLLGSQDGQIPSFNSSRFDIKSLVFVVDTGIISRKIFFEIPFLTGKNQENLHVETT